MESVQRGQYSQDKSHIVSPSRIKRLPFDQQLAKVIVRSMHVSSNPGQVCGGMTGCGSSGE